MEGNICDDVVGWHISMFYNDQYIDQGLKDLCTQYQCIVDVRNQIFF